MCHGEPINAFHRLDKACLAARQVDLHCKRSIARHAGPDIGWHGLLGIGQCRETKDVWIEHWLGVGQRTASKAKDDNANAE